MEDNSKKSIYIILGVGVIAVIFIIVTVLVQNRSEKVESAAFQDSLASLVFNAPLTWSVGKSESSKVQTISQFTQSIRQQSSQCSKTGPGVSNTLKAAMQGSRAEATSVFKEMYPGLVDAELMSSGNFRVLSGIDICDPVFVRNTIYFRGIVFNNNAQLEFVMRYSQSSDLSQAQLRDLARRILQNEEPTYQSDWHQFKAMLSSVKSL